MPSVRSFSCYPLLPNLLTPTFLSSAFAFHRTAYQDRIESVRKSLAAIEALRNYYPKPVLGTQYKHSGKSSSTTGTPGLSAVLGFNFGGSGGNGEGDGRRTPFDEKEHFRFLSGALGKVVPRGEEDGGDEADVEDDMAKKRKYKGKQKQQKRNRENIAPPTAQDGPDATINSKNNNTIRAVGSASHLTIQSTSSSRPPTPSNLKPNSALSGTGGDSPHRYPPTNRSYTPSRRTSVDGGEGEEALVVTAAKVLKTAVLHDARNIKGKDTTTKGLLWNVNSAHEAKVRWALFTYIIYFH